MCRSECKDPQDKIYGLLSLSNEHHSISPDYGKSVLDPYLEVLTATQWKGNAESVKSAMSAMRTLLRPYDDRNLGEYYQLPALSKPIVIFNRNGFGNL